MTTKTISTYIAGGYGLSSVYSELDITSTGGVGGGVYSDHYATVSNAGTVTSTATIGAKIGILFGPSSGGGDVINRAGGYIGSGQYGVFSDSFLKLANYGSIHGGNGAVDANKGASITNGSYDALGATISGGSIHLVGGVSTIDNFGTITAFVLMSGGGTIINGGVQDATALMNGGGGIYVTAGVGTVNNFGTIRSHGAGANGVNLGSGGRVTNGAVTATSARIEGSTGVLLSAAGTVTNFGVIAGTAPVHGGYGVVIVGGGSMTNGTAAGQHALVEGYTGVAFAGAAGTVSNAGTIEGLGTSPTQYGVYLKAGGQVTNGAGTNRTALIEGAAGISVKGAPGTIRNSGTILATGAYGVSLGGGGFVANGSKNNPYALIEGYGGLSLNGGSATNFGTISAMGDYGVGVAIAAGAAVTNGDATHTGALIEGYDGVATTGSGTVTNFGTIAGAGAGAVVFNSPTDVLVVEAGSTFIGAVNGGGGTVDLASGSGAITSLLVGGKVTETGSATTFTNFGTLEVGAGASFAVSGSGTIATGQGLIVAGTLTEAGTLTIAGSLTTTGTLAGTGTLALTGGTSNFNTGTALTIAKVNQSGGTATSGSTTLTYAGLWTQTAGTVSAATGDKFSFTGVGDKFLGALAGAGTIAFTGGTDALTGTTIKAAHVTIGAATVTLSGTIANSGAVSVTDPSVIVAAAGATLTGAGSINLSNLATNKFTGATAGSTLTNVTNKITGAGNLGGGLMTLVNQAGGTINGNQTLGLTIDTGAIAIANAGIIENTGTGGTTIASAVANTGTLMVTKGVLTVNGAVSGAGTVKIAGGTADFAFTFTENVAFTGATGVLELGHSQTYAGQVSGFSKSGTTSLDLVDIGFVSGTTKATFSGTTVSGTLSVTDGTHTAKITLIGDYTAAVWAVSSDGHGGTTVVDPTKTAVTQPRAPLLPFIAAAAGFAARPAASANADGEGWREMRPALAVPRTHMV